MKKTLKYALLLAGMTSLPAMAHVGYSGRNFGTFDGTSATSTLSGQGVTGNYGWIDGTDADYGDAHKTLPYRFTLLNPTDVTLTFQQATSTVTDHSGNTSTSQLGLIPGFSLYQGLAHLAPLNADTDTSAISKANRPANTEGAFRALDDIKIGNDPDTANGIPAALSFLKYIGHAYDGAASGSVSGFDGVADGKVSHTFSNLAAGDYSVFVGGSDYLAQEISNPNILTKYGVSGTLVAGVVPEPETYAMLLAGLGLMGAVLRRRRPLKNS
ncbi:FxDxF family PEP-CTERM protein [Nitrosospira sp. Is2]|uniref:FxDxF family PEP-CTERM protein n=1 Tax=Nitrosospira sp. Is2 TaxID=3080532 RepID=UPI002953B4BD|nr:FxDxF family PEP-CTERM protein [Nitrosospira sp. Is2]WON74108.1 FxDxF family PEP-CTERM protein [Nitrosospira sp. Is2]